MYYSQGTLRQLLLAATISFTFATDQHVANHEGISSTTTTTTTRPAVDIADAGVLNKDNNETSLSSSSFSTTSASNNHGLIDISSQQQQMILSSSLCSEFVECDNGNVKDTSISCAVACNGKCCVGDNSPCSGFTGKLCKDGSCSGELACENANIPLVVNSCKGWWACRLAGTKNAGGNIGSILVDSCNNDSACFSLVGDNGVVGNITSSCNGYKSCTNAGLYGLIGNISSSCNEERSCHGLGVHGIVGDILNSCNAYYSCYYMARGVGIDKVYYGYYTRSYYLGNIGNIINSCNAKRACQHAGSEGSCYDNTTPGGDYFACGNGISSDLNNCCNDENQCKDAVKTLPKQCAIASPTMQPSKTKKKARKVQ